MTRSICSSVLDAPRLKRIEFCARWLDRFIAFRTCDGSSVPEEHADPVETATPFEVERNQQRFRLDAIEADVGGVRHARLARAVDIGVGH